MIIIEIKKETGGFNFVGSRGAGEIIREKIKVHLDNKEKIVLNFFGIEQVTQGFVDEFLGILVRAFGIDYIKDKVSLANATQGVKDTINFVIKYSIKK